MSKLTLKKLKEWAKDREFSKEPLKLDEGVTILDREKFFNCHVRTIEGQKTERGKRRFYVIGIGWKNITT